MELDVILAHELLLLDLLVLPPVTPVISVVRSDGYVPDWSIEPDLEHFGFET